MSDQPTPETNEAQFGTGRVSVDFARRLERERDEAREQLNCICRDGFRYQDTISLEPCADYVLRKLKEERELARELRDALERLANAGHTDDCLLLNFANGHCDCGVNEACLLIAKAKEVLP